MELKQHTPYTTRVMDAINLSTLTNTPAIQYIGDFTYSTVAQHSYLTTKHTTTTAENQTLYYLFQNRSSKRFFALCPSINELESSNRLADTLALLSSSVSHPQPPHHKSSPVEIETEASYPSSCQLIEILIPIYATDLITASGSNNRWILLKIVPSHSTDDNKAVTVIYDSQSSLHPAHRRILDTARHFFLSKPNLETSTPSVLERLGQQNAPNNSDDGPWVNLNIRSLLSHKALSGRDTLDIHFQLSCYFSDIGDSRLAQQALAATQPTPSFWRRHSYALSLIALITLPSVIVSALILIAPSLCMPTLFATAPLLGLNATRIMLMPLTQVAFAVSILLTSAILATLCTIQLFKIFSHHTLHIIDQALTPDTDTRKQPIRFNQDSLPLTSAPSTVSLSKTSLFSIDKPVNKALSDIHRKQSQPWQYSKA